MVHNSITIYILHKYSVYLFTHIHMKKIKIKERVQWQTKKKILYIKIKVVCKDKCVFWKYIHTYTHTYIKKKFIQKIYAIFF